MKIVELVITDKDEFGVQAISLVDEPAIEEEFVYFKNENLVLEKVVDEEQRLLVGAALVPNRPIYRRRKDGEEYYVHMSKSTVRAVAHKFLKQARVGETSLNHDEELYENFVVESWIVEGENDKSKEYGLVVPEGTWLVTMSIGSDRVWNEYVKTGKVKGFSIEGRFADRMKVDEALAKAKVKDDKRYSKGKRIELESYADYPDAVKNNAKRGIELNEKNGNKCATQTGKVRAQQLANGEPVSIETVGRMYSYLSRAAEYYDESDTSACGTISYLLWGGKAALRWAESTLREAGQLEAAKFASQFYELADDLEKIESALGKLNNQ